MPLVRLEVRNEFGLGQPELYKETNREDPKAVLDGVAVAGLVGILRQLGDLADFAAEVFHGLQEQVMTTASRSHRLMIRVQNIEASLPPLEKAVLAQTSHIHFAYTAGCEWHPRIKTARNHFIYNDLPHFIMDSYEECRDPPRMHLLDKFDTGGPGSCFRRYSDPTFFKRASADSDEPYSEKTEKARKSRKYKKKRSSRRNGEFSRGQQMHSDSSRTQFISSSINGRTSTSTIDMTMKFDLEDRSNSFDSQSGAGYIECVLHPNSCMQPDEKDCEEPSSSRLAQETVKLHSISPPIEDNISHDSLEKQIASCSSGVTWDEKEEIVESTSQVCDDTDKTAERVVEKHDSDMHANDAVSVTNIDYSDILFNGERNLKPVFSEVQTDDIDSEPDNFMDALNSIESESEIDLDYETKRELRQSTSLDTHEMVENEVIEAPSSLFDNNLSDVVSQTGYTVPSNKETCKNIPDSLQENHPLMSEPHASNLGLGSSSEIPDSQEMIGDTVSSNKDTIRDLPYSLEEIHPHTSEPHASNLESVSPLHVPYYREEITKDTVSSNKKTSANFPDSLPEIPPLTSEPPVSNLGYVSPSDPHTSEPHASNLESVSPLHVPYYREEITKDTVSSNKKTSANFPDSLPEIPPLTSEPPVSNLGYVSPSDVPVSKEVPENFDDSHSSESPVCERDPHTRENTVLDHSVCTHNSIDSNTANDTVSEPVETDISFSGSKRSKLPDEEASKINNNKESLGDHSVRFWTNGGLLGLEPSKPPDFNLSSSLNQGSLSTKNEIDDGSRGNLMHKGQELSGEVVEQILNESSSRLLTTDHNDDQACISEKTSGGSQLSNGQTEMNNLRDTGIAALRSVLPAAIDKKDSPEHNQGNGENSPNVFGLANRLLIKSLHRKVSFDEKSGHYNSLKSVILEQSEQNGIVGKSLLEATFKEKVSSVYPIASLPPSPPLEHMKISFHPVNGLDTSKLKLKFPDGNNHHESIRDMFPSFQLVPESSIPLDDSGFHSDGDDTFCKSSPYVLDDCQTPRSDYDSDQWESDETPETSDHGADDSPHRRSSTESMSSTKEHGRVSIGDTDINSGHCTSTTNGVEPSFSGPLLDFPSFDNVSHVVEKESNRHSEHNSVVMSHSHPEPTRPPPPPPVPPMQWWVLKPQLEKTNETQNSMSEDSEHINDQSLLESSIFQQPRLAEVEQIQINHNGHSSYDNIIHQLKEKLGSHKLNGQKEANQLRMGKEMDEREDFLYQIRTKSFNLRPTVTGKPNATMGPTANVQVTAILEKANAIRQVVASDDGEDDDNWSDT